MKKNPLTEPKVDEDGRIWADPGPAHYVTILEENGDERRALVSNAAFTVHSAAERWSTDFYELRSCLVVREDTHEAVYFYKKGEGLQEGWAETDPAKAARRRAAYESGDQVISHKKA